MFKNFQMKVISHRGNILKPDDTKENRPSYIDCAIGLGFEVEVDIRFINGQFYLGHDTPDYIISKKWIQLRKESLWFHCKNLEAALELRVIYDKIKYFCHTSDPYTLTSNGYIWVHDIQLSINDKCIIPLLDPVSIFEYDNRIVYAVCTDYVNLCKSNFFRKGLI